MADTLQQRQNLFGKAQLEQRVMPRNHLGLATAIDQNRRARLGRLAGTHMRQHTMAVQHALDQNLQLAAGRLLPEQPRGNHTGIVEHHQIARAQMLKQISELTMCQRASRPVEGQQTTTATLGQWMASNQGIGEFEGKVSDAHDRVRLAGPGSLSGLAALVKNLRKSLLTNGKLILILRRH